MHADRRSARRYGYAEPSAAVSCGPAARADQTWPGPRQGPPGASRGSLVPTATGSPVARYGVLPMVPISHTTADRCGERSAVSGSATHSRRAGTIRRRRRIEQRHHCADRQAPLPGHAASKDKPHDTTGSGQSRTAVYGPPGGSGVGVLRPIHAAGPERRRYRVRQITRFLMSRAAADHRGERLATLATEPRGRRCDRSWPFAADGDGQGRTAR